MRNKVPTWLILFLSGQKYIPTTKRPPSRSNGLISEGRQPSAVEPWYLLSIKIRPNGTKLEKRRLAEALPGNGAAARIDIDMHQSLELFLVCAIYVDDNDKSYQQVYLYRLGRPTDGPSEIPLVEELHLGRPSAEICNEQS